MLSIIAVVVALIPNSFSAEPVALSNDEGLDESARRELRALIAVENIRDELEVDSGFTTDYSKVNRSPAILGPPTDEPIDFSRNSGN